MVVSRRAFGRDGNVGPAVLAFLAGVGWFAIDSVFGAQALAALAHVAYPLALLVVLAAQIALAVYGHNAIHAFERYAGVLLAFGFIAIAVGTLAHAHLGAQFDPHAPAAGGGEIAGVIFSAALAFSYAIGWGPASSDYSRYLPESSTPRAVSWWAALGGFVPSTLLELLGAAAVTAVRAPGIAAATPADTIRLLFGGGPLATIGLLTVLLGTLSANCLNLYSGALSALVAWDARRRPAFALAAGAVFALLAALLLLAARANDPTARYAPWVVAAAARRGRRARRRGRALDARTLAVGARGRGPGRRARARGKRSGEHGAPVHELPVAALDVGRTVGRRAARDARRHRAAHQCRRAHRVARRDRGVAAVLAAVVVHRTARRRAPATRRHQLFRELRGRIRGRGHASFSPEAFRDGRMSVSEAAGPAL